MTTHGKHGTRLYKFWINMRNKAALRNIAVEPSWLNYELFEFDINTKLGSWGRDLPRSVTSIRRISTKVGYTIENIEFIRDEMASSLSPEITPIPTPSLTLVKPTQTKAKEPVKPAGKSRAFTAGLNAGMNGISVTSNPYKDQNSKEWGDWLLGHMANNINTSQGE